MPSDFGFEPRSPRYDLFLVVGLVDTKCAFCHLPFLATFELFLGHIVELQGNKGLFVTRKSRRTWIVATVYLRLAVLNGLRCCFGTKKVVLGQEIRSFGRAPPDLAATPKGAIGELEAQTLDLGKACVNVGDG